MPVFVTAALAGVFLIKLSIGSAWADAVPPNYFGTYSGIETGAVAGGASFDESTTSLKLSNQGLFLRVHRDQRGRDWKIHYPPEWIIAQRMPCLGVRQMPFVRHLQFVICLGDQGPDGSKNMTMITPDGRALGEYIHDPGEDSGPVQWRLYDRYEFLRTQSRGDVTAAGARSILTTGSARQKIETLREIRRRLPDCREDEIQAFVDLVDLSLRSTDSGVQMAALDVIAKSARFTQSFEPLRRLVERPADLHPDVLSLATRTLGGLVAAANTLFAGRSEYVRKFGSMDLDELHRRTGGIIVADSENYESALEIFRLHPGPSRAWTASLRERVLKTLDTLANYGPSADARKDAQRVIDVFGTQPVPDRERCEDDLKII